MSKNFTNRIKVDGEKLKAQFKQKGLKASYLSKEMGKEESYFAKITGGKQKLETLGIMEANYLEKVYGIKMASYEIRPDTEQNEISNNEIYANVYLAVTQALADFFNNKNEED